MHVSLTNLSNGSTKIYFIRFISSRWNTSLLRSTTNLALIGVTCWLPRLFMAVADVMIESDLQSSESRR